jgi:hypothetical protein
MPTGFWTAAPLRLANVLWIGLLLYEAQMLYLLLNQAVSTEHDIMINNTVQEKALS